IWVRTRRSTSYAGRSAADRTRQTVRVSTTIVVSAVALVRDGAVLTVRKNGTSRFMLVGGKPEPGESAYDCAVRETREEVSLELRDLVLLGEFESEAANEPGHRLHSTVYTASLPGEPVRAAEIAELR